MSDYINDIHKPLLETCKKLNIIVPGATTITVVAFSLGLLQELESDIAKSEIILTEIINGIMTLDLQEQSVIYMRYINNLPWAKIADVLNYEQRQLQRIEKRAVEKLSALWND